MGKLTTAFYMNIFGDVNQEKRAENVNNDGRNARWPFDQLTVCE